MSYNALHNIPYSYMVWLVSLAIAGCLLNWLAADIYMHIHSGLTAVASDAWITNFIILLLSWKVKVACTSSASYLNINAGEQHQDGVTADKLVKHIYINYTHTHT